MHRTPNDTTPHYHCATTPLFFGGVSRSRTDACVLFVLAPLIRLFA